MKKQIIKIGEQQYLSDITSSIEPNAIYEKPTGAGITSMELKSSRHSILIEPNRPVIQSKCAEFNGRDRKNIKIRGVWEGITIDDIVKYLKSDIEYKKIITTPESYSKVKAAFEELGESEELFNNYFMLFDECEKTIQDINYREDITLPMSDFFKFKNKAFVSATPIVPSDPRFKSQRFKYILVKPSNPVKQPLNLIMTNNVFLSLEKHLDRTKKDQYFIFLNSTKAIVALMEYLGIVNESLVFCSEESKSKLALNGYKNVESLMLSSGKFKKYNFFTCRFNSAVDIKNIIDPNIIIITDCFIAEHTKVDPQSEVIQIIGRFRRPEKGEIKRNVTHISNINPNLSYNDSEVIKADIKKMEAIYSYLKLNYDSVTSHIAKTILRELLERTLFARYLNKDGTINHYMIDNTLFDNMVNGYYTSETNLLNAYKATKKYKVLDSKETYTVTDEQRSKILAALNKLKATLELLLPILKDLQKQGLETFKVQLELKEIEKLHPTAFRTIKTIGIKEAIELNDVIAIQKEVARIEGRKHMEHFGFMGYLNEHINVKSQYTWAQLKDILNTGMKKFGLTKWKPTLEFLRNYYDVSDRKYINTIGGNKNYRYIIEKCKFNLK